MNIVMIGAGYVGLVSAACFASFGFHVTCVDSDSDKINKLKRKTIPIYEPGLETIVNDGIASGNLSFTTDTAAAMNKAKVIFIAVGTPAGDGREINLQYIYKATEQIGKYLTPASLIVIKSTVPVGTCDEIKQRLRTIRPDLDIKVASNPEFLREGSAVRDFISPDRIVIGIEDDYAKKIMTRLYRQLEQAHVNIFFTTPTNAELIKYANNAFLALKITFINELANLCEQTNGDIIEVARALGLDSRIGNKFLQPGPGFGGSCLPKDTKGLSAIGQRYNARQRLVETAIEINEQRKVAMAERIIKIIKATTGDNSRSEKITIGVLGLAYKSGTDDMREAPSLTIIPLLTKAGFNVRATDPKAMPNAQKLLSGVTWHDNAYTAGENAHAIIVMTEWSDYRNLNLNKLATVMTGREIIDLRNIYSGDEVTGKGFNYYPLGRKMKAKAPTNGK